MIKRSFRKLRISLTNACNFSCIYCLPEKLHSKYQKAPSPEIIRSWVQGIGKASNIEQIRLTGGEPMLYQDIVPLVQMLADNQSFTIAMTTNGSLLPGKVRTLKNAGLCSINISLDAIDENIFKKMGGTKQSSVFTAVEECLAEGISVKLNSVLVPGMNESQIIPLLDYARKNNIVIRFLEAMSMGGHWLQNKNLYVPAKTILTEAEQLGELTYVGRAESSTSRYYSYTDKYMFGIIANNSLPFCSDCDRLRLDLKGNLYGCLSTTQSISLNSSTETIAEKLQMALLHKKHAFTGSALSMRYIGG